MRGLVVVVGYALVLAGACAGPRAEAELVAPLVTVELTHHAGSILGGVGSEAALAALDPRPELALAYGLRVDYVELDPSAGLAAAAGEARLFAALKSGEPITSTGRASHATRIAHGALANELARRVAAHEFGRTRELASQSGALPAGTTSVVTLAALRTVPTPADGPLVKSLRIELARPNGPTEIGGLGATVAVALVDLVAPPHSDPRASAEEVAALHPGPARVQEELLLFERPLDADSGPLAVVVPSPFADGEGSAFVVFLEARGPASDAASVERTLADCRSSLSGNAERVRRVESAEARREEFSSAFESLDASSNRRSALLFLAQATGATLAGDLALAADETVLADFVKSLPSGALELEKVVVDGSTLGFVLERGAFAFLAARGAEAPLAPELAGALVRRAGEVGRSSSAVDDLVATSSTIADLERALVEQNRIALEDSMLAVRVRGFDWLAARGLAPKGYDPFGAPRDRRAALDAAEQAP